MKLFAILFFSLATATTAMASPGAHGPNGEHLDAPGGSVAAEAGPRIETFTESFELVGQLHGEELSILIDRYETNEPVLNGTLEAEFNGLRAPAMFHADHGDYAIDDAKFLQALAKPGKHSIVFTLTTGDESDLLEGTLVIKDGNAGHGHPHDDDHAHSVLLNPWVIGAVLPSALLLGLAIFLMRRKQKSRK